MEKLTRTFEAQDDEGQTHTIHEFASVVDVSSSQRDVYIPGLKTLRLANGDPLTRLKTGVYQVVRTGVILKSSDPDAA